MIAGLLSTILVSGAQQPGQLEQQLQELKQQYAETTRALEQRIAALEQQIAAARKEGSVSTGELIKEAAERPARAQSRQVGEEFQG
ncbi:MAG TPA: hypothetical protein VNV86_08595, partial [Candidatus Acidoferrum sp.]|nr:hypothetical protein [Candidatus Acidoferrum sp.]